MTVKQWLSRANRAKEIVQMLEEEKGQAFETAVSVTAPVNKEWVKSSHENYSEIKNIEYCDYSILLDKKIRDLKLIQTEIETVISQIEKSDRYEILHRRYVRHEKFNDIADEMYLSVRQVFRIHKEAICDVGKILKRTNSLNVSI